MTRNSKLTTLLALVGCSAFFASSAVTFTFKSGAKFEGEVIEFKGTNSVVVRSAKDAKPYTITISMLTEDDQQRLAELRSQITGAFGMVLGQKFIPSSITALDDGEGYWRRYRFSPSAPLPGFTQYWVRVTPGSNRIWSIGAVALFGKDSVAAWKERQKLVAALEEKYGKAVHEEASESRYTPETDTITKDNREVAVRYGDFRRGIVLPDGTQTVDDSPAMVSIIYQDKSLAAQAEKESGGHERDELKRKL
jgi:hypothetical protein